MKEKTILLVEDNPDDEALTRRAFTKAAIANDVVVAHDGAEALEMLHGLGNCPLPTVVLLDLNLPRIGGLEVLKRLREDPRTKLLPVVVLTSSKEEEDLARSYALGCNAYVRKPVDFTVFVDAARTLGLFWLVVNETAG